MEIKKYDDIKEFVEKIDEMANAPSSEWQGKTVTKGEPLTAENIVAFFNANDTMLKHYTKNPVLGQSLEEFSKKIHKELDVEDAQVISKQFLSNIEKMRMPRELHTKIVKDTAEIFVQNKPTRETSGAEYKQDRAKHRTELNEFFKSTPLVAKDWKAMTNDAKVVWLNDNPGELSSLTGAQTSDELMAFLKDHGKELTSLLLHDFKDIDDEHIRQIALYCPNLQELDLVSSENITSKSFDYFENMTNLLDLEIRGSKFTEIDFDKLPRKLHTLGALSLTGVKEIKGTAPRSLQSLNIPELPLVPKEQVESLIYNLPANVNYLSVSVRALTEVDLDKLPDRMRSLIFCDPDRITNYKMSKVPQNLNSINIGHGPVSTYEKLAADLSGKRRVIIVWQRPLPPQNEELAEAA